MIRYWIFLGFDGKVEVVVKKWNGMEMAASKFGLCGTHSVAWSSGLLISSSCVFLSLLLLFVLYGSGVEMSISTKLAIPLSLSLSLSLCVWSVTCNLSNVLSLTHTLSIYLPSFVLFPC